MKKILFFTAVLPFLLAAKAAFAQKKNTIEGVWKIAEVTMTLKSAAGKDSTVTNSSPQPGLLIVTKGYYSLLAVRGRQPRTAAEPAKDSSNLTDAEKIARYEEWRPFTANSGTYEIKGTRIIRHPIVAKSVSVMTTEPPVINEFQMEGNNTLWVAPTPDRIGSEPKVKLTRVE